MTTRHLLLTDKARGLLYAGYYREDWTWFTIKEFTNAQQDDAELYVRWLNDEVDTPIRANLNKYVGEIPWLPSASSTNTR